MVRTGVSDDEGVLATSADVSSGASADTVVSAAGQKLKQGGTDAAQLNDANSDGAVLPRESINAHIHNLYVRQDFDECLKVIEDAVDKYEGLCEYPIYVKALIKRQTGQIAESLQLFQKATCLNPHNIANLKQVGRSLYLLGKHKAAIDVYEEANRIGVDDWEIYHNAGLCYMYLKAYELAIENFRSANQLHRHDSTYLQLGKVYTLMENYKGAIDVYLEALEFSPENPDILTTI